MRNSQYLQLRCSARAMTDAAPMVRLVRAQFDQINEAFELLHAGKCLRVVLSL